MNGTDLNMIPVLHSKGVQLVNNDHLDRGEEVCGPIKYFK